MSDRRDTWRGGPLLESIVVTPGPLDLNAGDEQQMTATGRYSGGLALDLAGSVEWSTTNGAVATVSASGLLTVVAPGVCAIVATLGGASGSALVHVSGGQTFLWFRWTLLSPSSDFMVDLPSPLLIDAYAVKLAQSKGAAITALEAPDVSAGDRTLTQLRVVASGLLAAGDQVDVLVVV